MFKKLIREPLVHFLLIGTLLFVLDGWLSSSNGPGDKHIVITPGQVERLRVAFSATWKRPPTPQEIVGLVDSYIKEEIYYREALAMGLDRDDTIIRRRMKQKMEFLSEDLVDQPEPDDQTLAGYLQENGEAFYIEGQTAFRQIYFNTQKRGAEAEKEARQVLETLQKGDPNVDNDDLGDPSLLPSQLALTRNSQIARIFGKAFVQHLETISTGVWSGPLASTYGLHLVRVSEQVDGRLPDLAEVRSEVLTEWSAAWRRKIKQKAYQAIREQYTVEIQRPEVVTGAANAATSAATEGQ